MNTQERAVCQLMIKRDGRFGVKSLLAISSCPSATGGGPGLVFSPLDDYSLLSRNYRACVHVLVGKSSCGTSNLAAKQCHIPALFCWKIKPRGETTNTKRLQLLEPVECSVL